MTKSFKERKMVGHIRIPIAVVPIDWELNMKKFQGINIH